MNIIFMSGGAREKALQYLLRKKENIIAVITPYLTKKNRRFENVIKTAIEFGIPVFPVKKNDVTPTLKKINYDILISCGFSYIIDKKAIEKANFAINVHPTLLPKYRGYRSEPYIIIHGETTTGVTIHLLTDEMDKGDILAQKEFKITPFDTTKSIYRKCREIEPPLLYSVIQQIKSGTVQPYSQDESQSSTYNYIRTPKDSEIDWNKPLRDLYNEIRACDEHDYPAFFYVDGQKVFIKVWRQKKPQKEEDMI